MKKSTNKAEKPKKSVKSPPKTKKPVKKGPSVRKDILFADKEGHFTKWSEKDFFELDFLDLLDLSFKNYESLQMTFLATHPDIIKDSSAVSQEISKSFTRLFSLFPTLKSFIESKAAHQNVFQFAKA